MKQIFSIWPFPNELSCDKVLFLYDIFYGILQALGSYCLKRLYRVPASVTIISTYTQRTTSQHASIYRSLSNYEVDFLFGYFPKSYHAIFCYIFPSIFGLLQTLGCILLFDKKYDYNIEALCFVQVSIMFLLNNFKI